MRLATNQNNLLLKQYKKTECTELWFTFFYFLDLLCCLLFGLFSVRLFLWLDGVKYVECSERQDLVIDAHYNPRITCRQARKINGQKTSQIEDNITTRNTDNNKGEGKS
jgi:hypothetical protein